MALRHLSEDWQDMSLREGTGSVSKNYFVLLPLQVLQVIDALLHNLLCKGSLVTPDCDVGANAQASTAAHFLTPWAVICRRFFDRVWSALFCCARSCPRSDAIHRQPRSFLPFST